MNRIIGTFIGQRNIGRDRFEHAFTREFDATGYVLTMPLVEIQGLLDRYENTDTIGINHVSHDGPFDVEIVESIKAFFEIDELEDLTKDQLEYKRGENRMIVVQSDLREVQITTRARVWRERVEDLEVTLRDAADRFITHNPGETVYSCKATSCLQSTDYEPGLALTKTTDAFYSLPAARLIPAAGLHDVTVMIQQLGKHPDFSGRLRRLMSGDQLFLHIADWLKSQWSAAKDRLPFTEAASEIVDRFGVESDPKRDQWMATPSRFIERIHEGVQRGDVCIFELHGVLEPNDQARLPFHRYYSVSAEFARTLISIDQPVTNVLGLNIWAWPTSESPLYQSETPDAKSVA